MTEADAYEILLICSYSGSAVAFAVLWSVPAPYGRYLRAGFGPTLPAGLGWMLMELPAVVTIIVLAVIAESNLGPYACLFLGLWLAHYLPRTFLTPLASRGRDKTIPLLIVALGATYNVINGTLNGRFLFHFSSGYPQDWKTDPRFVLGIALFLIGAAVNRLSDRSLSRLRRTTSAPYAIPRGGLFSLVSCPNYLGEIVQWLGWACATWSQAGLAFAVMSMANLVPRARAHHLWYRKNFPDYPEKRKALVPGVW